jgi:pSer/pThr/pTyr-binding forkhead associated (FHA) protein
MLGRLSPDDRVGEELDRDEVSREHANVWFDGSAVYLEDLGSTNGTWLAGRRITTRVRLPTGDVTIGLGRRVTVMVHVP